MMRMTVKVYEYSTGRSTTFEIGGYNYSLGDWYNIFATQLTDAGRGALNVRFGDNGSRDVIYIGETNTGWSYPQVYITEVQVGYSGFSNNWGSGWTVDFTTSLTGVEQTRPASIVAASNNSSNTSDLYGGNAYYYRYYDRDNTAYYVDPASTSVLNTVYAADAFQSDRFEEGDGTFLFRAGTGTGNTRHINLGDSTSDPSAVGSSTGISSGQRGDNIPYYLFYVKSPYNNGYSNYTRMVLGWHTGVEIGGNPAYGGTRFMADAPGVSTTELASVGKGDSHVRVTNNLYVGGTITESSDEKLKENIIQIDNALSLVEQLKGVYYNRIDLEDKSRKIGFIAQEVQEILPEVVTKNTEADKEVLNVSYSKMVALLTEAIKELSQQNKKQQQQIDELKELLKNK
jgi:hypothetical protein